MWTLRLYLDEDAGERAVVDGLRARGFDVLTTIDAGRVGTADSEQLAFAVEARRALYTLNVRDFARLHFEYLTRGAEHTGIIVVPCQRYSVGEKIRRLAGLAAGVSAEEMANRMVYL